MSEGILYIVPTPIGNLKDITLRAIDVLSSVDYIAAEDSRVISKLLSHYNIHSKIISYHKFNEAERVKNILELLKSGKNIALVSDAGTPGISDPGYRLIKDSIIQNIDIRTLPGPTAFVPALINSGFDISRFYFVGFLPKKQKEIKETLKKIENLNEVTILYEAPHRLNKTLNLLYKYLGDRYISISREITKVFESNYRGLLSELIDNKDIILKGEFVIIIDKVEFQKNEISNELINEIKKEIDCGMSEKDAIRLVSKRFKVSKNRLYDFFYQVKNK